MAILNDSQLLGNYNFELKILIDNIGTLLENIIFICTSFINR